MRKDTYNANKDLKAIGDEIARQYAAGQYSLDHKRACKVRVGVTKKGEYVYDTVPPALFTVGALRVRCVNTPEAVARIVARYRKGLHHTFGNPAVDKLRNADRAQARGTDFGALAVVEHETLD